MQSIMTQDSSQRATAIEDEAQAIANARKDPRAFGVLYDRYVLKIYRYLLSRMGSVEDARDVTSQTFLTAIETFPRYKHKGYFSAWLFSIARSKYVDHWRKAQRRIETREVNDQELLPDPLLQVIETERVVQLKLRISELTEEEQELLRLRYVAELGFGDMASVLNKNVDTVKKSLYRLLARLQSQMEK
jgi:RNA polymerase sigma-70 factor (ECF subfamily)